MDDKLYLSNKQNDVIQKNIQIFDESILFETMTPLLKDF